MKKKNIFGRKFFELTGCIHNHSKYSFDSKIEVKKIIEDACKERLDYITINDHMVHQAQADIPKKEELTAIVGIEINDKKRNNHTLVFNSDKIIKDKNAAEFLEEYKKDGAICFAAHPIEKRASAFFRKYPWTDHNVDNFSGLEIWNFLSNWVGGLNPITNGISHILFSNLYVRKPYRELLKYWDDLNIKHDKKVAIGSIDAHTETWQKFGIKISFLKHRQLFRTIRTNVLLENETDEQSILKALQEGNSYIVNYKRGIPYNFYAGISAKSGDNAIFGEKISFQNNLKFYYNLPKNAKVDLFCNGEKIASQYNERGNFAIDKPGFYRLEITKMKLGWIYTNNIYVEKY